MAQVYHSWSVFPRLQKRGPVEATQRLVPMLSRARFHAYKSVAPLKPGCCGARVTPGAMFPRLQKRGPIEALFGGFVV